MNETLSSPTVVSDVSLGKSSHHCISFDSLRMIISVDLSSLNSNALLPSRMEVNSGKSTHHSPFTDSLSNTTREQYSNAPLPKRSDFNFGKSSHHFIPSSSLFNSNAAYQKLQLFAFNSPISITSNEGTFAISHTE